MANKKILSGVLVLVLALGLVTGVFAQDAKESKHNPFDVLVGINLGLGLTPNLFSISSGGIPQGNYALVFDFGLTADFYLLSWLSFNSGLLLHPDIYLLLEQELNTEKSFTDYAATPLCITIPLAAHVNIPYVEWLYTGIGLNLNFPVSSLLPAEADALVGDTKGDFFVGIPIDIGFDMIKPGRGGSRFFFRITPEIHEGGTAVPIGFIWQIYNFKVFSK